MYPLQYNYAFKTAQKAYSICPCVNLQATEGRKAHKRDNYISRYPALSGIQFRSGRVFSTYSLVSKLKLMYRWFSRHVIITAMLVDSKQKIAHYLVVFVHQHLFISPLLFVSPEIAWKPPIVVTNSKLWRHQCLVTFSMIKQWFYSH